MFRKRKVIGWRCEECDEPWPCNHEQASLEYASKTKRPKLDTSSESTRLVLSNTGLDGDGSLLGLHNCDGLELLSKIPSNSVDMILTDPPYMTTTFSWDRKFSMGQLAHFVKELSRVLKPGGVMIVWFDFNKINSLQEFVTTSSCMCPTTRLLVWDKTTGRPDPLKMSCELAVLAIKKGKKPTCNYEGQKKMSYSYPAVREKPGIDKFHPTQKPVLLFQDLIRRFSNPGDVVLDCFLGSGTTAVAAKMTGRKCIGSEIDKRYFVKILKRIEHV